MTVNIFVSVGNGLSPQQEKFVKAVEERLRSVDMAPATIGRNTFSADAPLRAITRLMDKCDGVVVVALERFRFPNGVERFGSANQRDLTNVKMVTPWNQIEAAMAFSRKLPLLVLADENIQSDGLLDKSADWYVQAVAISPAALNSPEFAGILDDWRGRVSEYRQSRAAEAIQVDPGKLTIGQLLQSLRAGQAWALVAALASLVAAGYAVGISVP